MRATLNHDVIYHVSKISVANAQRVSSAPWLSNYQKRVAKQARLQPVALFKGGTAETYV